MSGRGYLLIAGFCKDYSDALSGTDVFVPHIGNFVPSPPKTGRDTLPPPPPQSLNDSKAVEQWGEPLIDYRNEAVLGFPREESLVFKFCLRKGLFSATGARRIPRQEVALGPNLTENRLVRIASGTALAMRAGSSVSLWRSIACLRTRAKT